jgi:hypothetical protein
MKGRFKSRISDSKSPMLPFNQSFLASAPRALRTRKVFVGRGWPVPVSVFNSIPDLYPLMPAANAPNEISEHVSRFCYISLDGHLKLSQLRTSALNLWSLTIHAFAAGKYPWKCLYIFIYSCMFWKIVAHMSEFSNQLGVSCSSYAEYFGVIGLKK